MQVMRSGLLVSSGILPSRMSAELAGRSRCLVAHPINPPYLIPAVELVPAPWTDPQVVERTRERLAAIGQVPIVTRRELDGFIMNRLQGALLHEAFRSHRKRAAIQCRAATLARAHRVPATTDGDR